ncbi:MAG: ATP-binding cassette domain-containing protein [Eubacteriales bacterium]
MSYISLHQVQYNHSNETHHALHGISCEIERGQVVLVVGEHGAGKTALLYLLGGMVPCDEGKIIVDGERISEFPTLKLINYRRNDVGFIFRNIHLVENLTAKENIELAVNISKKEDEVRRLMRKAGFDLYKNPRDITRREQAKINLGKQLAAQILKKGVTADQMLKRVGASHCKDRFPSQMTKVEQQRVAIGRALGKNPKLLLCDRPGDTLEPHERAQIYHLLQQISYQQNMTVIITATERSLAPMADRILHMKEGKITWIEENNSPISLTEGGLT